MMNYFSSKKKWMAYLILLTFVFTCIVPTNLAGGNSEAWASTGNAQQIEYTGAQKVSDDGKVKISKMISETEDENYFDITLTVETSEKIEETIQPQDAAVVFVLDLSNTMRDSMDSDERPANFANNRYSTAMDAADGFISSFASESANTEVVRKIGVVGFNTSAYQLSALTNCKSEVDAKTIISTAKNQADIIVNKAGANDQVTDPDDLAEGKDNYDLSHERFTNIEAGLKMGRDMLANTGATNKYIVLLSDGFPTTYIDSGYQGYDPYNTVIFKNGKTNKPCTYGTSYSDTAAKEAAKMATDIKNNSGITIYSIGVAVDQQTIAAYEAKDKKADGSLKSFSVIECAQGTTSYEITDDGSGGLTGFELWLRDTIGSNEYYRCNSEEALNTAYDKILQEVTVTTEEITQAWMVTDPMADNIDFIGFHQGENLADSLTKSATEKNTASVATVEGKETISWNLKESDYVSSYTDSTDRTKTWYQYQVSYRVRLQNEASGFNKKEYTDLPTNDTTNLRYHILIDQKPSDSKNITFNIPKVEGYLAGLSFTKVEEGTNTKLSGAQFELTHNSDCSVCNGTVGIQTKTSNITDATGKVNFTNIPSGHEYTLIETKAPEGYTASETSYPVKVAYDKVYFDNVEITEVFSIANTPEKTEATVKKVWNDAGNQDGKRPENLTVTLSNGTEVTLNEANGWEATVDDLPKYANGQPITYTWTEGEMPEGYTLTDTSVNGTITTLTNSYTPEKTEATVKKVWNDAGNQDGKRPESLTVTLSNGTEVTLNEANQWTATVKNLPVYANGQPITYSWTEDKMPEGYSLTDTSKEGTVTTLTNSYTPEETSATVKKVWNDAGNQDGKRPENLTVTLSNGTEVTLNEANGWEATVSDLPKYAAGVEIVYTWTEGEMPEGYTLTGTSKEGTVTTLTNSYTPEKTEATVKKVWNDAGNQDGKRPAELKVTLSNGTEVTLNEANGWEATVDDLPKYANGQPITYSWTEGKIPEGYTLTNTATEGTITTLTNSYNVETIVLEIIKAWSGDENIADRRNDIQFTITGTVATDNGTETISSQTVTATVENGWRVKVEKLPRYNDGKFITYTVSEDVPAGYTVDWDKNVVDAEDVKNGETATVTATNTLQHAGILFVKDYVGGIFDTTVPNDEQAAQFKLKAETSAGGEEIVLNRMGNTYSTTAGALQFGVMYTLSETIPDDTYVAMADRYLKLEADANGNLQVAEYDKDGKPVVNNNQNVIYPVQTDGYVKGYAQLEKIFNYPENATLKIFGNKSWVGGTTGSAITVELFRNGVTTGKTTEASVDFDWKYAFDGEFDRYDENGKPYIYTVVEHLIDGFTPYYGNTTDDNGNLVIDIVNVKNELSIDPYGDIWVEKQTDNDDYTSEYGFELWIQALKDESSNLNQEQQRDKTLLATALLAAKKDVEETSANIGSKTDMFEASAFATSGSQYRFFVTEADNCTTKLGVTTGSALEITGVNMRIAKDASYEGDWFAKAIEAIKTLVAEMAEAFVSGGQARPNTEDMLTKIRDNVTVTSGSALAYSEEGLTGMFDAMAAYKQAQKDLSDAESAFARFEASLSTPSSLILTVKGEAPITLNPAEGTAVDGGKVFTVNGNSKVQNIYYYEDGKYYVVPFKLVKDERIDFHMEATTGSAIQYKVTEVETQGANSTDLTIHFSADNKLTMANTLTSGIMELTSGSAMGFEFFNKYVIGGNTGSDPTTETKENDPEETFDDPDVPKGTVEVPGEPLDELDDPEIPLGDAPATGDTNNAAPFMALLLAAIVGLAITRRKFN